jgi:hypothetical protein
MAHARDVRGPRPTGRTGRVEYLRAGRAALAYLPGADQGVCCTEPVSGRFFYVVQLIDYTLFIPGTLP